MNQKDSLQIQGVVENYLKYRSRAQAFDEIGQHLDEDTISTFIEGNLSRNESKPIVKHLTSCGYCLNVTAEVFRLNETFEGIDVVALKSEPTKISEVLSAVIAKLFGSTESAVFAYQQDEENPVEETDSVEPETK